MKNRPEAPSRNNPDSDEQKAHTADRLRNDKARWKEHDQPDVPRGTGRRNPERDYPDPLGTGDRNRR
ncbi:hypothetical protein M8R20_28695 [Pseudomonas sp. R2.Fl]|nr:hypothetical protein [Pseudomonas sp. R2.Fl]